MFMIFLLFSLGCVTSGAGTGALAVTVGIQGAGFGLSNLRHRYPAGETFGGPGKTNKGMMGSTDLQGMKR
jgi:hypothetical protein